MKMHHMRFTAAQLEGAREAIRGGMTGLLHVLDGVWELSGTETWTGPAAEQLTQALRRVEEDLDTAWLDLAGIAAGLRDDAAAARRADETTAVAP